MSDPHPASRDRDGAVDARRDIPTKMRDRAALEASEERYRILVESNLDGVYLIQDGRFRYVNPALAEIFGYATPEEIVEGKSVDDLVVPEDRDLVRENLRRRLDGEVRDVRYLFSGLRKDGSRFRCEVRGSTVSFDGRHAVLGSLRDVSEAERAAAALAESEERYRRLFETAGEGIFIIDTRGIYRDANPAGCRMCGYSREELIGRHISMLLFPEERERYLANAEAGIREGREFPAMRLRRKDGSEVMIEMSVRSFEAGGETLAMGIKRDLTERLRAAEVQERFVAAIDRARKLESLGRLAGGVAHDFNNLLASIMASASVLQAKLPGPDAGGEDVEAILAAADRAAALTRQLLAFSRQQVLAREVFDLNGSIRHLDLVLRRVLPDRIALDLRLAPEPCPIEADRSQISQVLMNLVVNARDAIEAEGEIAISTESIEFGDIQPGNIGPGRYVRLSVSDTGKGIEAGDRERIFEPFFTTKPRGQGTGLGLSTVYGIVDQHGGRIEVESESGRGTTFRVDLRRTDRPVPGDASPLEDAAAAPGGNETILIVEDERAIRETFARGLRALGYVVLSAGTGAEAVRLAGEHDGAIDLIVSDVVLPDAAGPRIADAIRRERPGARILYISGNPEGFFERRSDGVGEGFLAKPFPFTDLARRIRAMLDG
ncbi:MAG: PAS domain S-box protein [Planctomycetes bacterium]|nr:PAS domain S-box protein [Planctomycetota bacterium]